MNKEINRWQWAGFLFTGLLGVLLHFLYDWLPSPLTAAISGINESTWEHMKLLFFPMFAFAWIQNRYWKNKPKNFWCVKLYGTLLGLALIPIIFYTFNGALGPSPDWYNIAIFFQAAAAGYLLEAALFKREEPCGPSPAVSIFILCLCALAFILFTWFPPKIPLFMDPVTGQYGLNNGNLYG